jgi:hypothetical protein
MLRSQVSQPAIYVASLATLEKIKARPPPPGACSG